MNKIKPYHIWFVFSLILLTIIEFISLKLPLHGDERHIVETIRLFTNNLSFETIKNYPEVTPPFFFIFYALWAKVVGQSIESLRILTLIISFITWQLLYWLNILITKNQKHSFLLSLLIIINPYFFGTSVYVFTDMLTILFVLASILSFMRNNNFRFLIFSTLAILCRQYVIIIPIAIIIYSLTNYKTDKSESVKYLISSAISFVPLIVLFILWKDIAPKSGIEKWIIPNSSFYNLDNINTYVTFSVVYIFPLFFLLIKKIRISFFVSSISLVLTILLSLFPIKPSVITLVQTSQTTVGYAHKFIITILGSNGFLISVVLGLLLFWGSYLNVELLRMVIGRFQEKMKDKKIVFIYLWFLFLLTMPLSYQVWEKYLTIVLPFFILNIYFLFSHTQIKNKEKN
jgi:4-amino-4-deoxy-L-arabinose transferase-like glycosyltransferase